MTPPKGKDFLCSIEHILERERNWVSISFLSLFAFSCRRSLYCGLTYYAVRMMALSIGLVETWWLPSIWEATSREKAGSRWNQKTVTTNWHVLLLLILTMHNILVNISRSYIFFSFAFPSHWKSFVKKNENA